MTRRGRLGLLVGLLVASLLAGLAWRWAGARWPARAGVREPGHAALETVLDSLAARDRRAAAGAVQAADDERAGRAAAGLSPPTIILRVDTIRQRLHALSPDSLALVADSVYRARVGR